VCCKTAILHVLANVKSDDDLESEEDCWQYHSKNILANSREIPSLQFSTGLRVVKVKQSGLL
jgi:hypothetical protein